MRRLATLASAGLEQLSPIVWRSLGDEPGIEFVVGPGTDRFLCFFLAGKADALAPKISLDQGDGYSDITALHLKGFPFAFYHVARERLPGLARVKFRPCAEATTFRFLAFQTSNAVLVAVLHYLFNLRYQEVALVARDAQGRAGRLETAKANLARIAKFFGDVGKGGGVRVQQGAREMLPILKLSLSLKAAEVQARVLGPLAGRDTPLISFVSPTYNTRESYLRDLLDSFTAQQATYAELVLSDDGSSNEATLAGLRAAEARPGVRVVFNQANRGIAAATNAGIAAARGDWIALIDHDDVFVPGAAAIIADAILRNPAAVFFYTDEIIVDDGLKPLGEFCKPAYDSVLLSGMNYINHFSVYRADRVAALGGLREDREGSQDYDLLLRYLAGAPRGTIVHIPFLAYMWRRPVESYSTVHLERSVASARRALAAAYDGASVEAARDPNLHRIRLPRDETKLVSIVIPNRDSPALIRRVVGDLIERTAYPRKQIIIVDNGTTDRGTLAFYETLRASQSARVDIQPAPFNFARMCNRGASLADGEHILFLNNDIEVPAGHSEWLGEMVECTAFDATGIVGALLSYPSGDIQHAGVIVGLGDAAGHWFCGTKAGEPGPMGRFHVRQTLSAVTAACMLVTRACYAAVGGFDEESFAIAYNDIDFCMRARKIGFRAVWTPFAHLVHHESVSRGSDESGAENLRFQKETRALQARHDTTTMIDDAFSPFYDRRYSFLHIHVPDELPVFRPNQFD